MKPVTADEYIKIYQATGKRVVVNALCECTYEYVDSAPDLSPGVLLQIRCVFIEVCLLTTYKMRLMNILRFPSRW